MGKKSKRNRSKATKPRKEERQAPSLRVTEEETLENLQFQDPFVEEYDPEATEDDYGWEDGDEEGMEGDLEIIQAWNPFNGVELAPGEKLEMDPSAYKMHHAFVGEWPALSFDFIRDDLGDCRTRFPHSVIAAVGTQANQPGNNSLTIIKLSDLDRIRQQTKDDILGEEYDKDSVSEDDSSAQSDAEIDLDPIMEHYAVPHYGGVNRVRTVPQDSNIVATWSDIGRVNLYKIDPIMERFEASSGNAKVNMSDIPSKPFFSYEGHSTEGYAMDWSLKTQGSFVTGDCAGSIHLWNQRPEGGYAVQPFYESDASDRSVDVSMSVEDLQWSPTESTVFAAAECGGYVRIFDTRAPHKAMLIHKIHSSGADVNVVSWNRLVSNLLATGGDDGVLSVWDLRHFSDQKVKPLARFTPHKSPITSVEWHPTDESMLAVTDDSGAYVYDLSVEEDDTAGQMDVPPQLLFVHAGSEQFKEVHWHPQITSCLMTTALSGYSVFIPSNL